MQQNTRKYDLINSLFVCSGSSLIEGHIEKKVVYIQPKSINTPQTIIPKTVYRTSVFQ